MITMIACLEINNGIADKDGNLLFNLPNDMAHFKAMTSGKHVVMGRKTWDSLPKKPLPKRKNYVLTKDETFKVDGKTKILHSIEEVLALAKNEDVWVIGGGEIYNQMLPFADKLIITHVHTANIEARVFFPDLDVREWNVVELQKNEANGKHEFAYSFATYARNTTKKVEQ
jgi:dihydrofolate reductase